MVIVAKNAFPHDAVPIPFSPPFARRAPAAFEPDPALTESFMAAMAGFNFLELGEDIKDRAYSPPGSDSSTTADSFVDGFNNKDGICRMERTDRREDQQGIDKPLFYEKDHRIGDNFLDNSGCIKKFEQHFKEDLKESCDDTRTTLMIRNIPRKYTQQQLLVDLTAAYDFSGGANFFYLPTDLGTCRNLGYCFLNLTTPEQAVAVKSALHKRRLSSCAKSGLSIGYADFQGLDANVRNVRRSLMHRIKNRDYRPLLADENGALVPMTN